MSLSPPLLAFLLHAARLLTLAVPALGLYAVLSVGPRALAAPFVPGGAEAAARLPDWVWTASLLPGAAILGLTTYVLFNLARLLSALRQGTALSLATTRALSRIGRGFVALAAVQVLAPPLLSVLLSAPDPAGEGTLTVTLGTPVLWTGLAGLTLWVAGAALGEGLRAARENAAFV